MVKTYAIGRETLPEKKVTSWSASGGGYPHSGPTLALGWLGKYKISQDRVNFSSRLSPIIETTSAVF